MREGEIRKRTATLCNGSFAARRNTHSKMDEPVKTARFTTLIEILGGEPREEGL